MHILSPKTKDRFETREYLDVKNSRTVLIDKNPGRSAQTVGIARELGTDIELIHEPSVGVIGNKGDSQCYLGVQRKVETIHDRLRDRIGKEPGKLKMRLVQAGIHRGNLGRDAERHKRNALFAHWTRSHA